MLTCKKCGGPKEPTRKGSKLCRACDGPRGSRRLTLNIPDAIWNRLDAEATAKDQTIGPFVRDLIIARDTRKQQG